MIRSLIGLLLFLPLAFDARADKLVDRLIALQTKADGKPADYFSAIEVAQESCMRREFPEVTRYECPFITGGEIKLEVTVEWRSTSKTEWRRMTFWLFPESESRSIQALRKQYFSDWDLSLDAHQQAFDDPKCGYRLRKVKDGFLYAVRVDTGDANGICGARIREFVFSKIRQ